MPNIYLAGPMTGIENDNVPLFRETAMALEDGGWSVFNPALQTGKTYREYLSNDLDWITKSADAVAFLPGWEKSLGSRAEHATAVALNLQIIYLT